MKPFANLPEFIQFEIEKLGEKILPVLKKANQYTF
ncbi:DUF5392 family protein [Heyndrickxia acidiproducens]